MRRRANQKRLVPLVLALLATMVGAALAVPAINLNVQELDKGTTDLSNFQTVIDAFINWDLGSDPTDVDGATIKLATETNPGQGTVYLLIDGSKYLATYDSSAGVYKVSFSPPLSLDSVNSVTVIYQGPQQ